MTSYKASSVAQLSELIDSELAVLRELKPVLQLKQRALVENQVAVLHDLADQELRLGGRLSVLEEQRLATQRSLATELGDVRPEASVGELIASIPAGQDCFALQEGARKLREEVVAVGQLNLDNGHLMQNLLDYTAMVIRLAARTESGEGYGRDGKISEGQAARALLDDRI